METFLLIAQIIISVLLIVFILLQQRGAALGSAFGGAEGFYATRRGIQKKIYIATLIFGILFIILSLFKLVI